MSFEKMMEELKRDYVDSLPQKIKEIEMHLSANDSVTLRDDFHKLKGTGKTYGLPEVTELGAAIEMICINTPGEIPKVLPLAVNLLREIHRCRNENKPFSLTDNSEFLAIRQVAGLD